MKLTTILISMLCLTIAMQAQLEPGHHRTNGIPISGAIVSGADFLELGMLKVQVVDIGSRRILSESQVGIKGSFQLAAVPTGFYELSVIGQAGDVRYSQEFQSGSIGFLQVALSTRPRQRAQNSISAIRLMHQTPKAATRELESATKALRKGNRLKAIEHLEKAAVIDAENFEVTSNLGALYLQEREPYKASEWLMKAHRIDPVDSVNNVNLSAYFANEGQFDKAEEHALNGLKQDPNSVRGRYMLAVALVRQGKNVDLAKTRLAEIENQFPPARNLLHSMMPRE